MKTAVIGSTSFLSRYLITDLVNEAHELTLFSRKKINCDYEFIEFDYPNKIPDLSVFLHFDNIIYLAAAGVQSNIQNSTDQIYGLNTFFPIRLINYLVEKKFIGKIITFGSYFEIGSNKELIKLNEAQLEVSVNEVPNHYCLSKRLLTRFSSSRLYEIKHYQIILPSIYGKHENNQRLIPYVINSLKNQKIPELTAGTQIRQFLHAKDVSNFVTSIFKKEIPRGTYNLAPDKENYVSDVVKLIFKLFNLDHKNSLGKINRNDESMQVLLLDNSKAKLTGWKPKIELKEGILDYLNEVE